MKFVLFSVLVLSLLCARASASINLPAPGGGLSIQYGDFDVYSLGFLQNLYGDAFKVVSTPGAIDGGVVLMTGASGNPVNDNFSGMDNAYPTPSGNGGDPFFSTGTTADPGSNGSNPISDPAGTWDTDVSAIRSFLSTMNGDLVFFFNLNETNDGGLGGQDELAWAKVTLTGSMVPTMEFILSGTNTSAVGPQPDPTGSGYDINSDQWVYVNGQITVAADGSFLHYGPKVNGTDPAGSKTVSQNLGANEAAFAIFNQDLNKLVKDPLSGYTSLSVDIRLSQIDNGFEQAFILGMANVETNGVVPELTSMLTWIGLSTIGGGVLWRRRAGRQAT